MDNRSDRAGNRGGTIALITHRSRWRSCWFGICMTIVLFSLAGCGSKKDGTEADAEEVAEKFWHGYEESEKENAVGKKYSNDSNSYQMELNEEKTETVLVQRNLDGSSPQKFPEEEVVEILSVTNQELYYKKWEEITADTVLWRVPIQKTQEGDVLLWKERKGLAQSERDDFCLVPDSCVIYEDDNLIHKLELSTDETAPLCEEMHWTRPDIVMGRTRETVCIDGNVFIQDGGNLYCLDTAQEKAWQIYGDNRAPNLKEGFYECYNSVVTSGDSLYFTQDFKSVWQYRLGEEQAVCAVSQEQLLESLQKLESQNDASYQDYSITGLELYQNELYLAIRERGKDGVGVHWCLFHSSIDDFQALQHDRAVTEYLENGWRKRAVSEAMVSVEDGLDETVSWEAALYLYPPMETVGIREGKLLLRSVRLVSPAISAVHYEISAAYDLKTKNVLERPDIIKVY